MILLMDNLGWKKISCYIELGCLLSHVDSDGNGDSGGGGGDGAEAV